MRCSNGNVDEAIRFYYFDDDLRVILLRFLIRFEIQAKSDFIDIVESKTQCESFWKCKKYYLPDAIHSRVRGRHSKFYLLTKKIEGNILRMRFLTIGSVNHAAMYVSSYGTFQELFKYIHPNFKEEFIKKYTVSLKNKNYHSLNVFLEGIRIVRNRCAHGNHIISKKLDKDLSKLRPNITRKNMENIDCPITILEGLILYLSSQVFSGVELLKSFMELISKYNDLLVKYDKRISLSKNTYKICCKFIHE